MLHVHVHVRDYHGRTTKAIMYAQDSYAVSRFTILAVKYLFRDISGEAFAEP